MFDPPPTINFTIDGDRIVAVGSSSLAWIHRARTANRMVPDGAPQVDLSQAIQSQEIRFDLNNTLPANGQEGVLDQLAAELKELTALSSTLGVTTRVSLTGNAEFVG